MAPLALDLRQLTVTHGQDDKRCIVPLSRSLCAALQAAHRAQGKGDVLSYRSDFPARMRSRALARAAIEGPAATAAASLLTARPAFIPSPAPRAPRPMRFARAAV